MKTSILLILVTFIISIIGCRKEVISLDKYGQTILNNSVYKNISQLQADSDIIIIKENKIRAMAYIKEYADTARIDSLAYLEFDRDGKLAQRTTDENTTVGCLRQTIRQIFNYEADKLIRVDIYTFKYKVDSKFEKWMEDDITKLNKLDYEDYTYNGDTIIIESGYAVWNYVKDVNKNLVKSVFKIKNTHQSAVVDYNFTPYGLSTDLSNSSLNSTTNSQGWQIFRIESNNVNITNHFNTRDVHVYDNNGLLIKIDHYVNDVLKAVTRIEYFYYAPLN